MKRPLYCKQWYACPLQRVFVLASCLAGGFVYQGMNLVITRFSCPLWPSDILVSLSWPVHFLKYMKIFYLATLKVSAIPLIFLICKIFIKWQKNIQIHCNGVQQRQICKHCIAVQIHVYLTVQTVHTYKKSLRGNHNQISMDQFSIISHYFPLSSTFWGL